MSDPSPDITTSKKEDTTPKPQNSIESLNSILAFQVQDLIDKRIDKAEGQLQKYNQNDLKRLSDKWKIWAIIVTIIAVLEPFAAALIGYFIAPPKIHEWIKAYIEGSMIKPELEKVAADILNTEMSKYVEGKINPLKADAGALSVKIETINSEIEKNQKYIENAQTLLKEQLDIQQCIVAAKAGTRDKYEELKRIAGKKLEYKELVDAALKDIEFYYEAIKYELAVPTLTDPISQKDPGFSIEEVIYDYRESDVKLDMREAAIDTLIDYNNMGKIKENVIQELCESVNSEQNLRVIARTTLLLNKLTGKSFRSLEIDAVRAWWEQNKNETKYQSPYKEYLKVIPYEINTGNARQSILLLDKTIEAEPDALHARCLRGFCFIVLDEPDKAEKEFEMFEKGNKDFSSVVKWRPDKSSPIYSCQASKSL